MSNLLGLEGPRTSSGEYDNVDAGPDPDLAARIKRGANWFYWIAGLSVVNSIAFLAGTNYGFLGGLGITQVVDEVVAVMVNEGSSISLKAVAIGFDFVVVIGFGLAGYFANKFSRTAFIVGIIVYVVDTVIVLLLGAYFMAAFHAFALYQLINGYLACREMKAYLRSQPAVVALPPPPPAM
jgi:hypothetical protein